MAEDAPFTWYKEALDGRPVTYHDGDVHCGYYRMRAGRSGTPEHNVWVPVGIWSAKGEIVIRVSGQPTRMAPEMVFSRACRNPVEFDDYKLMTAKDAPDRWPDGALRRPETPNSTKEEVAAGIGHNRGPDEDAPDPFAERLARLEEEEIAAKAILAKPIVDQDHCDKVANRASSIAAIKRWFGGEYEVQARPSLNKLDELRAKFKGPEKRADDLAKALTRHQTAFLDAKQKRISDEARRVREEAERQAREAREAAEKARREEIERIEREDGAKAALKASLAPPPEPEAPQELDLPSTPAPVKAGGHTGRATRLVDVKKAVIVDPALFAAWCVANKIDDILPAMQKIADRFKDLQGMAPPEGVEIKTEKEARR